MAEAHNPASSVAGAGDAASTPQPLALCASEELIERGQAVVFDVMLWRAPARAFALRFDGQVVAYMNRCAHVPTEMDWQAGHFLDLDKRWIICSIHGAVYEPANGHCVAGPCAGGRLIPIAIEERAGTVYWYPSRDIQPVVFDDEASAAGAAESTP